MKIAIDTRHDTLEEALAVVALAFESSGKGSTTKPEPPAKRAPSDRRARGPRATRAEPEAASTARQLGDHSEPNGSRRRVRNGKGTSRKATDTTTVAKDSPPKKSTARKAVATGATTSVTVTEPGSATKAAASKAPAAKNPVSGSATANGKNLKAKRVAGRKTTAKQAKARPAKPTNVAPPGQSDAIRAWARSNGMQVADAGRMSAAVIAAYNAQHH
jgi:hypothetical protein